MFYEKVKAYCTKNSISEYRFERMCSLPNGIVGSWRRKNPSYGSLIKICKGTGTTIGEWVEEPEG